MTIQEKIEKRGYQVKASYGWVGNEQKIIAYQAIKNGRVVASAKSKTALYNAL